MKKHIFLLTLFFYFYSKNIYSITDSSIFLNAVLNQDYILVKELLKEGVDPNVHNIKNQQTPVHIASYEGDIRMLNLLIKNGADVNVKMEDGFTPLHLSSQEGHLNIVKSLIKAGAYLEMHNKDEFTALHLASLNGHLEVVQFLIESGAVIDAYGKDNSTPLQLAAQNNKVGVLAYLLAKGSEINHIAIERGSALHFAVHGKSLDALQFLISKEADINLQNKTQATPFVWNGYIGSLSIAKELLKAGANPYILTNLKYTALHTASMRGNTSLIKYFLQRHIYTGKEKSNIGLLAIDYASFYGHKEAILDFIQFDPAFIDMRDAQENTPLYYAIENNQIELVKFLVTQEHCNTKIKNINNETPLQYAQKFNRKAIIRFLSNVN